MSTEETKVEIDQKKVHDLLSRFELPPEIEGLDTTFGSDSTGDPAVWITFHVRESVHIGPEELQRLTKFLSSVTSELLQGNIAAFPYTRLEQAA